MNATLVKIQQAGKDIGWGKLGAVMPGKEGGAEITLHDVKMTDGVEFEIAGPFRIEMDQKRFRNCKPVNFRSLRPACDYERVIFTTDEKPKI